MIKTYKKNPIFYNFSFKHWNSFKILIAINIILILGIYRVSERWVSHVFDIELFFTYVFQTVKGIEKLNHYRRSKIISIDKTINNIFTTPSVKYGEKKNDEKHIT